jgi:hypothetical protein
LSLGSLTYLERIKRHEEARAQIRMLMLLHPSEVQGLMRELQEEARAALETNPGKRVDDVWGRDSPDAVRAKLRAARRGQAV